MVCAFYSFFLILPFLLIIPGHDLLSRGSTGPSASIPDISIAHSSPMCHKQFSIITTSSSFTALLAINLHQQPPSFQLLFDIKISACLTSLRRPGTVTPEEPCLDDWYFVVTVYDRLIPHMLHSPWHLSWDAQILTTTSAQHSSIHILPFHLMHPPEPRRQKSLYLFP
jgi:hypothetical protein